MGISGGRVFGVPLLFFISVPRRIKRSAITSQHHTGIPRMVNREKVKRLNSFYLFGGGGDGGPFLFFQAFPERSWCDAQKLCHQLPG